MVSSCSVITTIEPLGELTEPNIGDPFAAALNEPQAPLWQLLQENRRYPTVKAALTNAEQLNPIAL
jgi:hypothetical protein